MTQGRPCWRACLPSRTTKSSTGREIRAAHSHQQRMLPLSSKTPRCKNRTHRQSLYTCRGACFVTSPCFHVLSMGWISACLGMDLEAFPLRAGALRMDAQTDKIWRLSIQRAKSSARKPCTTLESPSWLVRWSVHCCLPSPRRCSQTSRAAVLGTQSENSYVQSTGMQSNIDLIRPCCAPWSRPSRTLILEPSHAREQSASCNSCPTLQPTTAWPILSIRYKTSVQAPNSSDAL